MASQEKFSVLRSIMKALGLSSEAINDIIERIDDFLNFKGDKSGRPEYPYHIRDHFLSPAEHSFYLVLKHIVADEVIICTKVSLSDIFYVRSHDASKFRIYTNKIDRKHVDFLLCNPKTMQPIVGIELNDKSHQIRDRRERDAFVEKVYAAAKLPLVRFPVRRSYSTSELESILNQYLNPTEPGSITQPVIVEEEPETPHCPICSSLMVLRTAKSGPNKGGQFWGCPNFPDCRGIRKVDR